MNLSARPAPPRPFGWFREQAVHDVTLGNPAGLQAQVMTWGAVIRCLSLPDAAGGRLPLTLGFESFDPYPDHSPYFGATVGRYANRIGNGQFDLAGETCRLDRNEAQKTTLHGGRDGFARRIWDIEDVTPDSIALGLISADGDQGFPGTLRARCIYRIIDGHRLEVRFEASTDRATPVNLAQHSYFNLDGGRDTAGHRLQIFADAYTPTGSDKIPTGEIRSVAGSAFDFREPRLLRDDPPRLRPQLCAFCSGFKRGAAPCRPADLAKVRNHHAGRNHQTWLAVLWGRATGPVCSRTRRAALWAEGRSLP